MKTILLVGVGGFLGSVARYKVGGWVGQHSGNAAFPYGTFWVNVLGCLAIGLIAALAERQHLINQEARFFIVTGFLGGFTTFSAFGLETFALWKRGQWPLALAYVLLSVTAGLGAVWLGDRLLK